MNRITVWFNNLSLYKKILTIFSLALLAVCATFLISLHFLTARYDQELYRTSASSLKHVTAYLESEMETVQGISDTMIGDNVRSHLPAALPLSFPKRLYKIRQYCFK